MKFEVVYHHAKWDDDCSGDYCLVEIYKDGNRVTSYGDSYHDSGEARVESFIEGVKWAIGKEIEITEERVADYE